ncbi:MAG: phage holin family protein [Nocardioides sp.]
MTQHPYDSTAPAVGDGPAGQTRSLGDIVGDISKDLSSLVRQEMDLAKTELKQEITKTGKGAGMLGAAGVAGLLTLVFLSLAVTHLLDNWMPVELAALIVSLLWGAAAAVLAVRGRNQVQQANPQLPTTQHTLKEDVQWAKAQKS